MNISTDMDELRLYLIGISNGKEDYIQKKVNLTTGKIGFFINEKINFLTILKDLDITNSITRDGKSEGTYQTTFAIQASS